MKLFYIPLFLLFGILCSNHVQAQTVRPYPYYSMLNWDTSPYKSYRFTRQNASWEWINFRLLFPNGYDSTAVNGKEYPLIIVLHGGGESGRREWDNTDKTNSPYPVDDPRRDNNDHHLLFGGREHLAPVEDSGRFPGLLLFPQNSYGNWVKIRRCHPPPSGPGKGNCYLDRVSGGPPGSLIPAKTFIFMGCRQGESGTWLAAYKRPDPVRLAALPMSAFGNPAMTTSTGKSFPSGYSRANGYQTQVMGHKANRGGH